MSPNLCRSPSLIDLAEAPDRRAFVLDLDLKSFAIRGSPRPEQRGGLFCGLAGHLAADGRGDGRARQYDRLAEAYHRHGHLFSAHLLGQYCAAIVDIEARKVILTQDSLGISKLYYRHMPGRLTIASRLADLVALANSMTLNERYFAYQLATGYPLRNDTPFEGIECLAYGKTLVFEYGSVREYRPWLPQNGELKLALPEAAEQLRDVLDEAVRSTLPETGTVLCELSGGLDSTTVAATAARQYQDIHALTFESGRRMAGDDEEYAEIAATVLGLTRHAVDLDDYPLFMRWPERFSAESGGELVAARQDAYDRVVEESSAKIILTGEGGDVVFGYGGLAPAQLADPIYRGAIGTGVASARQWAFAMGGVRSWTHYFWHSGVRYAWLHARHRSLAHRHKDGSASWLNKEFVKRNGLSAQVRPQVAPRLERPGQQYLWEDIYEIAGQLSTSFRQRQRADTRHPLLHRPLVELMVQVSQDYRHGAAGDRILQREALIDRLPEVIRRRSTKGSTQELTERALMDSQAWYRAMTDEPRLVALGWIEPHEWRQTIERARCGVFEASLSFRAAMLTEIWIRNLERYSPVAPVLEDAVGAITSMPPVGSR